MGGVSVVTDSTSDISREEVERLGITIVPLRVHFGDETYLDYEEISPEEFFQKLTVSPHFPKTSQPPVGDFLRVYEGLARQGKKVLSIHISSGLSGTVQSANMARESVREAEIEVIDSRTVSLGCGFAVVEAAKAAREGADLAECARLAREILAKTHVYFILDTLEYLHKNGRIGKAQHLLGNLLNMKPILTVSEGVIASFDRVRGKSKVIPRMLDLAKEKVPPGGDVFLKIGHANALERAEELAERFRETYGRPSIQIQVQSIGPVIGTHSGPGLLGLGICPASAFRGETTGTETSA